QVHPMEGDAEHPGGVPAREFHLHGVGQAPMTRFVVRRLLRAAVVLWGVTSVVFVVTRLSGDPITLLVAPDTPLAEIERLRHDMGLDASIVDQYVRFLGEVTRGDFGRSIRFGEPAMRLVLD